MQENDTLIRLVDKDENNKVLFEGHVEVLKKALSKWKGKYKNGDIVNINGVDKCIVEIQYHNLGRSLKQIKTYYFQDK